MNSDTRICKPAPGVAAAQDSVEQYIAMLGDMAAPVHAALTTLPGPEVARLRELIAEGARPYAASDGALRLPATALCASGRV